MFSLNNRQSGAVLFGLVSLSALLVLHKRQRESAKKQRLLVVRLVGWASGIINATQVRERSLSTVLKVISLHDKISRVIICWDGDQLAPDSFTSVLEPLFCALPSNTLFVAHKRQEDICDVRETLLPSMLHPPGDARSSVNVNKSLKLLQEKDHFCPLELESSNARLVVVSISDPCEFALHNVYVDLALRSLRWSRDVLGVKQVIVVSIGGGDCIREEKEAVDAGALYPLDVVYHAVHPPVSRKKGDKIEQPHLVLC